MMHIVMPLPSLIADSLVKLRPFSDSTIELSGYRILSGDGIGPMCKARNTHTKSIGGFKTDYPQMF